MNHDKNHLIKDSQSVRDALRQLDQLAIDAILFVVNENGQLAGSLTDGDLRRGFIKGLGFEDSLMDYVQPNPKVIKKGVFSVNEIIAFRAKNFMILPVVDEDGQIVNVINLKHQKSYLPIDAILMAGGRGERLRPLTDTVPKSLLQVGTKPIIEHNIDRLRDYGIDDVWISVRYLGEQIETYFQDGQSKSISIKYIYEKDALGTAGAVALVEGLIHNTVLVMNSDLLTNINFEDFYLFFEEHQADLAVACIPYQVNVPYAVMDTENYLVTGFKEKPTYTHYSNAGIYLMKREVIDLIPKGTHFNATDLMENMIKEGKKVAAYPLMAYWLDIGKHDDFKKAQEDIKHINLA